MLEQVLTYLKNWFVAAIYHDTYTIADGTLTVTFLQDGQYFRIIGSLFNDGLYQYGEDMKLTDETFDGSIWALAVPKIIVDISNEITEWQEKYGDVAASPYTSESFGGYSYSKGSNASASGSASWQDAFAERLAPYRKLREMAPVEGTSHQDYGYQKPYNYDVPWG